MWLAFYPAKLLFIGAFVEIELVMFYKSSFILPGKSGTNALSDVLIFVTPFTNFSMYPGVWNRKRKKMYRKN